MTGRHRVGGKHRKPVQPNPHRRSVTLRVICGCAACAAVIPLFAQTLPAGANPPDLTSAQLPHPAVIAPVTLMPVPPQFTIQPRIDTVDMVSEATGELSKRHDSSKGDDSTKSDSSDSKGSSTDYHPSSDSSSSSGNSSSDDSSSGKSHHDTSGDSNTSTPPPTCR